MAKDPAFLFYTGDFLKKTYTLNNEQIGKYIRLIVIQHSKNHISEKDMLFVCGVYDEDIMKLFTKDDEGNFFDSDMRENFEQRKKFTESRRKNILKRYNKTTSVDTSVKLMENEDENENVIDIEIDKIDYKGDKINMKVIKLFPEFWQRSHNNEPELIEASSLVTQYGMKKVKDAFYKSALQCKTTIPYVKGILTKQHQDEAIKKHREEKQQKEKEVKQLSKEEIYNPKIHGSLEKLANKMKFN